MSDRKITKGNFSVEILKHSANPDGYEAITFQATYERFIHAEVMTHRWSRNYSSSRAIPYEKMREWIRRDPALPLHLGTNRPGMQSGAEVDDPEQLRRELIEMHSGIETICDCIVLDHDPHKEIINRYAEPWGWITGIMTMGRPQLMNFFSLRCTGYAHPNIQRLAVSMARLYRDSTPQSLDFDQWHMPYFDDYIPMGNICRPDVAVALHWSVARSAWCSYNNPTKDATYEMAKKRHDDCVSLKHATPLEPQLRARMSGGMKGLVPGFDSYRSMIPGESARDFDFGILDRDYAGCDYIVRS